MYTVKDAARQKAEVVLTQPSSTVFKSNKETEEAAFKQPLAVELERDATS